MKTIGTILCAALLSSTMATAAYSADTLHIWMRYGDNEKGVLDALTSKFTKETGIKVDLFLANVDFETRLARAAVGGNLPDLLINDVTSMGQMREMGILKEIDRSSIAGSENVYDVAWKSAQAPDGKYFGVPTSAQAFAVFERKDWREKLGYDIPKTWDDLYALAKAFTEDDPDGNGVKDTYGYVMPLSPTRGYATWFLSDLIWQAGGQFLAEKDGKFTSSLATPEVATALGFARKMICNGYAQPAAITSVTGDTTPVFASGQAGIYRSGPYHIQPLSAELNSDQLEVIPPPAGPAGQAELAEGEAIFMMATTKAEAEAKKFIEFMISQEGQEIGMGVGIDSGPIVRLSVNKNIDTVKARNSKEWGTFAKLYGTTARYFPRVPNWKPIRQMTSEGFNAILADCNSDIAAALPAIDDQVNQELARQGVLAK